MLPVPKGAILIPSGVPEGPARAREAWADALGQLLMVVEYDAENDDIVHRFGSYERGWRRELYVKSRAELHAAEWQYTDGTALCPE